MLFVISPAKSLDYDSPIAAITPTQPLFIQDSAELIAQLQQLAPQDVARLMRISDTLAMLNVARFTAWQKKPTQDNARAAILAFNGDVYTGLDARSLTVEQLNWAQQHACILSGLYGVLRPLDLMQPYRLEMGTKFANTRGSNLYQFWGTQIAQYLQDQLAAQRTNKKSAILVNLASQEYFKAIDRQVLTHDVADCVFEDWKGDKYKIISFYAKRARGMMLRYAIENQAQTLEDLTHFASDGYCYDAAASSSLRLVFRRKQETA